MNDEITVKEAKEEKSIFTERLHDMINEFNKDTGCVLTEININLVHALNGNIEMTHISTVVHIN